MNTQINLVTIKQRLDMLKQPPASPIKGRNANRVDITGYLPINEYDAIIQMAIKSSSPHFTAVSFRETINSYGKIGYPKHAVMSPELFNLFQ